MNECEFVERYQADWRWLADRVGGRLSAQEACLFPERYRLLCEQLAFARAQGFSVELVNRLNVLAREGYGVLYRRRRRLAGCVADFVCFDLPMAVYRERYWLGLAAVLFVGAMVFGWLWLWVDPDVAARFGLAGSLEYMYRPDFFWDYAERRGSSDDVLMWGHYIYHNTSISLKVLAGGALAGVVSGYVVAFNGVHFGMGAALMADKGWLFETYLPFVITHGAFELTAIVLAGGASFSLACALFFPKRLSRGASVRLAVERLLPILVAVIVFDFIAAGLEAFWSPRNLAPSVKLLVGTVMWGVVLGYLCLGHRWCRGRGYA